MRKRKSTNNPTAAVKRGGQGGFIIRKPGEKIDDTPYVEQLERENQDLRRRIAAYEEGKRARKSKGGAS